jgi:hypothetical protein
MLPLRTSLLLAADVCTNFKPAIATVADWKPDLRIYLTYLQSAAGNEPAFLVL